MIQQHLLCGLFDQTIELDFLCQRIVGLSSLPSPNTRIKLSFRDAGTVEMEQALSRWITSESPSFVVRLIGHGGRIPLMEWKCTDFSLIDVSGADYDASINKWMASLSFTSAVVHFQHLT